MKVLVIGRHGQVAESLASIVQEMGDVDLVRVGRPDVDLEVEDALARAIAEARPNVVINAAAYTAVDRAESEESTAHRINADAPGEGAIAAAELGIPFIQLSTDYVFDGSGERAWREADPVEPINAYGRTKADGEAQVLAADPRHIVVRTSWVVSPFGHNFVKSMLRLAAERDEIAVVDDQRGCPTSALDLAKALLQLARRAVESEAAGIFHLAAAETASWADLAEHVMACSAEVGGPVARIRRVTSREFPTDAIRPSNSVLDCSKARDELGIWLPRWRDSTAAIVAAVVRK